MSFAWSVRGRLHLLVVSILLLAGASGAQAGDQHCEGKPARSAADFQVLRDGSQLLDRRSGLVWARCIEGQHWRGTRCEADDPDAVNPGPRMTWAQALQFAASRRSADEAWRLPTKRELVALREPGCYNPSMDLQLFPTVPAWSSDGAFWTSTREAQGQALVDAIGTSDSWATPDGEHVNHVRLVRDVPAANATNATNATKATKAAKR